MRMKARKELEGWDEEGEKQKKGAGEQRAPRLTMLVVMQRPSLFFKWISRGS